MVFWNWKVLKCQDLPKFQFGGGGVFWNWKVLKCQDLPKFQFSGGGVFWNWKVLMCQDLPKFQFSGGGGILKLKSQSAKISDNFHFWGGGGCSETVFQNRGRIWTKISTTPAGSCITDSLSHTTYVETKNTHDPKMAGFWHGIYTQVHLRVRARHAHGGVNIRKLWIGSQLLFYIYCQRCFVNELMWLCIH